jgi:hypothetical protein
MLARAHSGNLVRDLRFLKWYECLYSPASEGSKTSFDLTLLLYDLSRNR